MSFRRFAQGLVLALATAVLFGPASAYGAKPSGSSYAPTLAVSMPLAAASTSSATLNMDYLVSGCGYSSSYGAVTIVVHSPTAVSWAGQMPDSNGCISLTNFAAQSAGHYQIDAYQTTRNRSTVVASTSFDL
jgi:hypothetical protein